MPAPARSFARLTLVVVLCAIAAAWLGCNGESNKAPAAGNLFANPGFEDGAGPWFSLETEAWGRPFAVSQQQAHSGAGSAALALRSEDGGKARVYGLVQEVSPDAFPDVISGYYYVDRWEQGTPKQYLQAVVIVWNADNQPAEAGAVENYQVRYVLAGVDAPPLAISNAHYIMAGTGAPQTGRWIAFERNVRQDFEQLWGAAPEGFDRLRILFEVRWDDRSELDGASAASVYYDDLYLGPAAP